MRKVFFAFSVVVIMLIISPFTFAELGFWSAQSIKKTKSGEVFKRVSERRLRALGIKDTKKFGEAWEDPSGMVWGDMAKHKSGTLQRPVHYRDAKEYCERLGAELPSGWQENLNGRHGFPNEDSDFVRLRKYMGAEYTRGDGGPWGYIPQILPNLAATTTYDQGETQRLWMWSSTNSVRRDHVYAFDGLHGIVDDEPNWDYTFASARCVVRDAQKH